MHQESGRESHHRTSFQRDVCNVSGTCSQVSSTLRDLQPEPAAHDYTCCLKLSCGFISAFVTTTEAFCVQIISKYDTFECEIAQCLFFCVFSSLSRYKLKFSPDKVDTMIVQAICKSFSSCLHPFIIF